MLNLRELYLPSSGPSSRAELSSLHFTDVLIGSLGAPLAHGESQGGTHEIGHFTEDEIPVEVTSLAVADHSAFAAHDPRPEFIEGSSNRPITNVV